MLAVVGLSAVVSYQSLGQVARDGAANGSGGLGDVGTGVGGGNW